MNTLVNMPLVCADLILFAFTAAALLYSLAASMPKPFVDLPRHALICCAHSDDCVIMGAEFAYGLRADGLSVLIVYLTCSSSGPETEIARARKAEAINAWARLGLDAKNLIFLNLPASPVKGPACYSNEDIARASRLLQQLVSSLPANPALVVPASGESHVDHRVIRKMALEAVIASKRKDILVYETPEYNSFLSVTHSPRKTIAAVFRHIPMLNRLIKPYMGSADYIAGTPGMIFYDNPNRLKTKRNMLSYFQSQDPDLLQSMFGYPTKYRKVAVWDQCNDTERGLRVSAFGGCCDWSVVALGFVLVLITFLTSSAIGRVFTVTLSSTFPIANFLVLFGGLIAGFFVIQSVSHKASIEGTILLCGLSAGLIFGAIQVTP